MEEEVKKDSQLNDASEDVKFEVEVEVEGWDINPILFLALLLCGLAIHNVFSFISSPLGIVTLVFAFGIYKLIKLLSN